MADWTIPGDYIVTKDHGADLDLSSSHHDFKLKSYTAILEMRLPDGTWLGPQVTVRADKNGASITKFDGTVLTFPTINFDHAGVQGLLDRAKIVTFVSAKVPDPR